MIGNKYGRRVNTPCTRAATAAANAKYGVQPQLFVSAPVTVFSSVTEHTRTELTFSACALSFSTSSHGLRLAGLLLLRLSEITVIGDERAPSLSPLARLKLPCVPLQAEFVGEALVVAMPSPL